MPTSKLFVPAESRHSHVARVHGRNVRVEPATRADRYDLRSLYTRASDRLIHFRFITTNRVAADRYLATLVRPQSCRHQMLVARIDGELVGAAGFDRVSSAEAEINVFVADDHQRNGVGRLLLGRLALIAAGFGIRVFIAEVLATNSAAVRLAVSAGEEFDVTVARTGFGLRIVLGLVGRL